VASNLPSPGHGGVPRGGFAARPEAGTAVDPVSSPAGVDTDHDDLTDMLLSQETMQSVLLKVAERAVQVVPGTAEASVTLVEGKRASSASWTGLLAYELDETQYGLHHGPCLDAATTGEPRVVTDMRTEARWPGFAGTAVTQGCLSSLSVPISMPGDLRGCLNLYSIQVAGFDGAEVRAVAAALAGRAAAVIDNMWTFEQALRTARSLQTALDSRAVIEQAKGILMARHGVTADAAFQLLATRSQRANRKLRDLAVDLVTSVVAGPVPGPEADTGARPTQQ
jgi:GAF domain-containing protein